MYWMPWAPPPHAMVAREQQPGQPMPTMPTRQCPQAPRSNVGVSADGCVAIPNLNAGTVTTVKDGGNSLLAGIWQITGQEPMNGGIAVSVRLPAVLTIDKATLQCSSNPVNLSRTFRGANLGVVLNRAAEAWCATV